MKSARGNRRFRTPAQAATAGLLRAADEVRRRFERLIEPHGVTFQQYNVLRILRGAAPEPLPTLEIRERMIERAPAITGLLDRLERKGLVVRARCEDDRRIVHCSISDAGMRLLEGLDEAIDRADEEVVAPLDPRAVEALIEMLGAIGRG